MSSQSRYIMNVNRMMTNVSTESNYAKPPIPKEKVMSYEEKSVGSTAFFKCEACPYMALAEDDIKFHLFTAHPDLAKTNGLADNIQILCPGCTSIFDAEETLRTHLRNHHKMGIKDVKKMIKSLVQIALKNAKLKKEENKEEPATPAPVRQEPDLKMPQVIEIIPDTVNTNNEDLPKGVAFISVDELQQMSTPNFEKVDPKEIIQEASINIVYTNNLPSQYVNVSAPSNYSTCNLIPMSSVPPDLISSIQPRVSTVLDSQHPPQQAKGSADSPQTLSLKRGRAKSTSIVKNDDLKEVNVEKKLGTLCQTGNCHVRLKDPEKLAYHRKCHQNGNLQCPECNQLFSSIEPLHTHLWKTHTIDMELPTCNICDFKTYKRHKLYNIHMKSHGPYQYTCPVCAKQFKSKGQLMKHCVVHKEGKTPSQCPTCQREFSTERRLRDHIAAVHNKIRPFQCCHCSYTAARKEELKVHLRSHTGDKPYSCNKCNYRSGDHNAMRRHKKLHSKESTYKCKHCPYSTIQSTAYAAHMISRHPNVSSSDLHLCPYCPYKTVNREKYIGHLTSHPDKEGIQLLIEMNKSAVKSAKPSWTIPSENTKVNTGDTTKAAEESKEASIPIEVYDCDSQQDSMPQKYPKNYSTHPSTDTPKDFNDQVLVTDLSKDDNNSDCLISESSNDTVMERHQYPPQHHMPSIAYDSSQKSLHFLNTTVEQSILQNSNVNSLAVSPSPIDTGINNNIMSNFPIRLPLLPQISVRNNITLKPVDKISLGPIIKPTQILPVPSSSNSPVSTIAESEGAPRKKPKISVKSNLILKGPDQVNMFHSQQKMAFKRLEDNERFGLGPVTFNNLITTQFMQLPPESSLSESPSDIMPYPQETMLDESATPPVDTTMTDSSQIFSFNQQMNVSPMSMLPPQPKIQTSDPSYIKLEGTIKQNNQSPSLERMCNANVILNNPAISREYKASPPLEDIHKNMSEIKNEVKSDFYNIPLNTPTSNPPILDQYLIDNLMGEYSGHLDLSTVVMPVMSEDQQNDVIEIDDNSDDNKLLPRFDMNFPLESLYLMHNDFYTLENDIANNITGEPVSEMNRMVTEVPILNQKENVESSEGNNDFPNFIEGKKDPMMNTSVRPSTNKINVKNIELMKN